MVLCICEQQRPRYDCIYVQSDQGLHCSLIKSLSSSSVESVNTKWNALINLQTVTSVYISIRVKWTHLKDLTPICKWRQLWKTEQCFPECMYLEKKKKKKKIGATLKIKNPFPEGVNSFLSGYPPVRKEENIFISKFCLFVWRFYSPVKPMGQVERGQFT